ncbi:hypothetical protein BDV96DRAFT_684266 [Lophiotrema nucula]|uniref:AA1-like domain-containing protein n=1 Tax=Lophiotrema nucula TaxID=690887 RepID=A0A6A5ZNE3_9PLEO|nr:hypothetical protein BDV96DRAFT_684266 [Lophiotrema nucula]
MFSKLTILALPALAAAASCPAPPSPPSNPSCGSTHPKWTLDPINLSSYYTYTSPSASGPKLGSFSFTFATDQVDYEAQCSGSSVNPQGIFYGSQVFECVTPGGSGSKTTSFSFDSASSVVSVNTTFTCCDVCDVVYTTIGSVKIDLECETSTWRNPDWVAGELYSNTTTVCEPGAATVQL